MLGGASTRRVPGACSREVACVMSWHAPGCHQSCQSPCRAPYPQPASPETTMWKTKSCERSAWVDARGQQGGWVQGKLPQPKRRRAHGNRRTRTSPSLRLEYSSLRLALWMIVGRSEAANTCAAPCDLREHAWAFRVLSRAACCSCGRTPNAHCTPERAQGDGLGAKRQAFAVGCKGGGGRADDAHAVGCPRLPCQAGHKAKAATSTTCPACRRVQAAS